MSIPVDLILDLLRGGLSDQEIAGGAQFRARPWSPPDYMMSGLGSRPEPVLPPRYMQSGDMGRFQPAERAPEVIPSAASEPLPAMDPAAMPPTVVTPPVRDDYRTNPGVTPSAGTPVAPPARDDYRTNPGVTPGRGGAPVPGAGEYDFYQDEEFRSNPRLALLAAAGGREPRNWMAQRVIGDLQDLLPALATVVGYARGVDPLDAEGMPFAPFAAEMLRGFTGGGAPDVRGALFGILNAAGGGDEGAMDTLAEMSPSDITALIQYGDRQRGMDPAMAAARQRIIQRRLEEQEVRRIQQGATLDDTGGTQEWARLLAELAGR